MNSINTLLKAYSMQKCVLNAIKAVNQHWPCFYFKECVISNIVGECIISVVRKKVCQKKIPKYDLIKFM